MAFVLFEPKLEKWAFGLLAGSFGLGAVLHHSGSRAHCCPPGTPEGSRQDDDGEIPPS